MTNDAPVQDHTQDPQYASLRRIVAALADWASLQEDLIVTHEVKKNPFASNGYTLALRVAKEGVGVLSFQEKAPGACQVQWSSSRGISTIASNNKGGVTYAEVQSNLMRGLTYLFGLDAYETARTASYETSETARLEEDRAGEADYARRQLRDEREYWISHHQKTLALFRILESTVHAACPEHYTMSVSSDVGHGQDRRPDPTAGYQPAGRAIYHVDLKVPNNVPAPTTRAWTVVALEATVYSMPNEDTSRVGYRVTVYSAGTEAHFQGDTLPLDAVREAIRYAVRHPPGPKDAPPACGL